MMHMRNHYDGTILDSRKDVGAESSHSPFRYRPLYWKFGDKWYHNERTIGIQITAWNFVAQLRGWLPPPIGGLIWFAADDATFSVHAPFHAGTLRVPKAFADGNGDALTYSDTSAFWAMNTVGNFIYPRWYAMAEAVEKVHGLELKFVEEVEEEDKVASEMYKTDPHEALEYLTKCAGTRADSLVSDWRGYFGELMVKYRDGLTVTSSGPDAPDHGGKQGGVVPKAVEMGFTTDWKARIIKDTGDRYLSPVVPPGSAQAKIRASKMRALNKGMWTEMAMELDGSGSVQQVLV